MSHNNNGKPQTRTDKENPYLNKEKSSTSQNKKMILDLSKYFEKRIKVKFLGGREVIGILKGHDPLLNLVLDETVEIVKALDGDDTEAIQESFRELGLLVCRGPNVVLISPMDGAEEIENPFI